ncbi:type IV pilin-like G/H family protein [Acaryochloris thomasi]|nr:type IV pilin-like G/H family protein [Acaryochloris thomasi]
MCDDSNAGLNAPTPQKKGNFPVLVWILGGCVCLTLGGSFAMILLAIALPFSLNQIDIARDEADAARNEVNTEKESEAKSNLGTLNRAQQAFHLENSIFAQELETLDARPSGQYFTHQVVPQTNSKSAIATATPVRSVLKSYTGFAFILGSTSAEYKFVSGICDTNFPIR